MRQQPGISLPVADGFQSTHPGGVRHGTTYLDAAEAIFQSTHPGGVRLPWHYISSFYKNISIHAPGWGATVKYGRLDSTWQISIHAPGWGATFAARIRRVCPCAFQSTHPGGVRRMDLNKETIEKIISIHAPGWGATSAWITAYFLSVDFNPRTRVGCDLLSGQHIHASHIFQSTHPGGVRPTIRHSRHRPEIFQSTHPGGVRPATKSTENNPNAISIHAPGWGATC